MLRSPCCAHQASVTMPWLPSCAHHAVLTMLWSPCCDPHAVLCLIPLTNFCHQAVEHAADLYNAVTCLPSWMCRTTVWREQQQAPAFSQHFAIKTAFQINHVAACNSTLHWLFCASRCHALTIMVEVSSVPPVASTRSSKYMNQFNTGLLQHCLVLCL